MEITRISCPDYQFNNLDLEKVSNCLDAVLREKFSDKKVVIRGMQSEKHDISKDQLIEKIIQTGTDRNESEHISQSTASDTPIDLFGYETTIQPVSLITLPILEGFHKWKPKSLERPQLQLDIWMIYDANLLTNVEYNHGVYRVKASDGYLFNKPGEKSEALIGLIVID